MPLFIKRIYDPPSPGDGYRLLIMRKWPRGIRKDAVSAWEKELGPSLELLQDFRSGKTGWAEYCIRYLSEMRSKPDILRDWAERARRQDITLLCGCKDETRCHRSLLKSLLESIQAGAL